MDLIHRIRDKMREERLMFVYRGVITRDNSIPLLTLLERELENSEFNYVGRKRLFMFVLESLQNVSRHTDQNLHSNMSLVVYSKVNGGYTVTTGNVISSSNTDELKRRLDNINNLKTGQIRAVYRQVLSNAEFSSKGGAGLGLIEMAKISGNKLDYDFVNLDLGNYYFILSKTVDSKGLGIHLGEKEKPVHSQAIVELEKLMAENNAYLIWSGPVTADVGKEVLSFTETRLTEEEIEANVRRRIFSIMVEIIENVAKYSPGHDIEEKFGTPVAIIRFKNKIYSLTTGNLILNSGVDELKNKLETINNFDKTGLKSLFRESLSGQTSFTESTGNMGLIEMARKSGNKLLYRFEQINDIFSYFTITVNIEDGRA